MMNSTIIFAIFLIICLKFAHFASFSPQQMNIISTNGVDQNRSSSILEDSSKTTTISAQNYSPTMTTIAQNKSSSTLPATTGTILTSTTLDPNGDSEEFVPSVPTYEQPGSVTLQTPNQNSADKITNQSKPSLDQSAANNNRAKVELNALFFSVFIVYVSFIKLIYHNVAIIKHHMTEPGILMIFGIVWELVSRQMTANYDAFPRFNSRIFFYLFLPSTIIESANLLSNKWLFLNLLPILVHSIFGTLLYASSLGFTIYSLSRQNIFNLNSVQSAPVYSRLALNYSAWQDFNHTYTTNSLFKASVDEWTDPILFDKSYLVGGSSLELNNLTLGDCLVFGTILSTVDSTSMLSVFRILQVNEKLYYLVMGESLLNNAVVLVVLNLLLDFFNETRLTVVKVYVAIIQFSITLIGSLFLGFLLAGVALISVRLTKRFQLPSELTSYQNQCQAMVETLLILKLAYLTYILAGLAGTSSIISLATFGILQDQYIKHNLNLRSQLTFKQVILATKTLGYSLVYPLLGMLLVEVANTSQFFRAWNTFDPSGKNQLANQQQNLSSGMFSAASVAVSKLSLLANKANLYWNFKFLSLVVLITVVYRFIWVILLSLFCNLFSSNQLKIKFKEQILVAYGGLKGPLAFAIVHRMIEHEEYRDRTLRNKHLFIYTILFITFISTIVKGSFIKPLVSKMQLTLSQRSQNQKSNQTYVFDEINSKVTEYMTHGLNCILGHTKSPYDKFVDFNELRLKPWLTRDGLNTNWLSVFYDDLILDETLNSDCFYRSIGEPAVKPYWHVDGGIRAVIPPNCLDTIDENGLLVRRRRAPSKPKNLMLTSSTGNRKTSISNTSKQKRDSVVERKEEASNAVLKEFVMFNLKLEAAEKRKSSKILPSSGDDEANQRSKAHRRMLSTTSSGEFAQGTSSFELIKQDKRRHIIEIERRLNSKNTVIPRKEVRVTREQHGSSNLDPRLQQSSLKQQNTFSRIEFQPKRSQRRKIRQIKELEQSQVKRL